MFIFNSLKLFFLVVPVIGFALVFINFILAKKDSYNEKTGPFECGFSSFAQSRTPFTVPFILVAILFLPFDLEISSILPYVLSLYFVNFYGLVVLICFLILLVAGFIFEFNYGALHINRVWVHKLVKLEKFFFVK